MNANTIYSLLMQQSTMQLKGSPMYIPKRSQVIRNKVRRARAERSKRK